MTTIEAGSTITITSGKTFRVIKADPKARLTPISVQKVNESGEAVGDILGISWDVLNTWFGRNGYRLA